MLPNVTFKGKSMLYIRTDANRKIATGHMMRCISIAKIAREKGIESVFILSNKGAEEVIKEHGFLSISLDTQWDYLDMEIDIMCQLVVKMKIEKLLIDSYYVTDKYLNELMKYTRVTYIDDKNEIMTPVDCLINYNIYGEQCGYGNKTEWEKVKLLLGCKYVPLRKEFINVPFEVKELVTNILVTTGGNDSLNISSMLIEYLETIESFKGVHFHIVSGKFNANYYNLRQQANQYSNVTIHENVKEMSKLITTCDVAISASGTTLYELCACGIPSISFVVADNQIKSAQEFWKKSIIFYAGDMRKDAIACFEKIKNFLELYMENVDLRYEKKIAMRTLVDGRGAERIIQALSDMCYK